MGEPARIRAAACLVIALSLLAVAASPRRASAVTDRQVDIPPKPTPTPHLGLFRKPYDISLDINQEGLATAPSYRRFRLTSLFDHDRPDYDEPNGDQERVHTFSGQRLSGTFDDCQIGRSCYSGHPGYDYGTGVAGQTDVLAIGTGVVRNVYTKSCGDYPLQDQVVVLGHDIDQDGTDDYRSEYQHLDSVAPSQRDAKGNPPPPGETWKRSQKVEVGEAVGKAGNRGCSTAPHIHLGLKRRTAQSDHDYVDPFGWWGDRADPWTEVTSEWLWLTEVASAPQNGGSLSPDSVASATGVCSSSFQKFMPSDSRRDDWHLQGDCGAESAVDNQYDSADPYWWSEAIEAEVSSTKTYANWAVWGLGVPVAGSYRLEAFLNDLTTDSGLSKTTSARYVARYLDQGGDVQVVPMEPLDQSVVSGDWARLVPEDPGDAETGLALRPGATLIVTLTDQVTLTGQAGRPVEFGTMRLVRTDLEDPPSPEHLGPLAITLDDSTSMLEVGKLSAIRGQLTELLDKMLVDNVRFSFHLVPFEDRIVRGKVVRTSEPSDARRWLLGLDPAADESANPDCPEASLEAVLEASTHMKRGPVWLITDDIPKDAGLLMPQVLTSVLVNQNKLHALVYPSTCTDPVVARLYFKLYWLAAKLSGGQYFEIQPSETANAIAVLFSQARLASQLRVASGVAAGGLVGTAGPTSLPQGAAASDVHVFGVDETILTLGVLLNVASGTGRLDLYDPTGALVAEDYPNTEILLFGGNTYVVVSEPLPGEWRAEVTSDGEYAFTVSSDSKIALTRLAPTSASRGRPATLSAKLTGPVRDVQFRLVDPIANSALPVPLTDDGRPPDLEAGDGLYAGTVQLDELGDYRLEAAGSTQAGGRFERTDSWLLHVQSLFVTAQPDGVTDVGGAITHVFGVGNSGPEAMAVELAGKSSEGWPAEVRPSHVELAAGSAVDVPVTIRVPWGALPGTLNSLRLTATKLSDDSGLPIEVASAESLTDLPLPGVGTPARGLVIPIVGRRMIMGALRELPDLEPYVPEGWDSAVVASTRAGTTSMERLRGYETTYFDVAVGNTSRTAAAPAGVCVAVYLDDDVRGDGCLPGEVPPGHFAIASDVPLSREPGWHTVRLVVDPLDRIPESNEANNVWRHAFYWEP